MGQATKRAARLMYIRDLLVQQALSANDLAIMCDVTIATIYRDLVDLQIEPLSVPLCTCGGKWFILDITPQRS